ncbi:MAG: M14 family metallopeptidase [Saprospiraceae bacterium]|nr:M14 family metallopeptidase [Saprospiraceae bacterium]
MLYFIKRRTVFGLQFVILFTCFMSGNFLNAQSSKMNNPDFTLPFEKGLNQTVTYADAINYLMLLEKSDSRLQLYTKGNTDAELPIHVAVLSDNNCRNGAQARSAGKVVVFINNGIHPGEPEGIDATLAFFRDLPKRSDLNAILKDLVLVMIPVYNIEGCLNRNSYSRANQNGPESYGFRGNGQNYDLNRDFIKADSRNSRTFASIFQDWQPDIFIDNHTSNGADYTYTMTLLATQHNKLGGTKGDFLHDIFLPEIYKNMEAAKWPMCPYVNTQGALDNGIYGFNDGARYSSGYASLFGAISFLPETHMLKPFKDRLLSNYVLMDEMIKLAVKFKSQLILFRSSHLKHFQTLEKYPLNWRTDKSRQDSFRFKGYTAEKIPSTFTGKDRTFYNQEKPFEKELPFYTYSTASLEVDIPEYYIIPPAYHQVLQRFEENNVEMYKLKESIETDLIQYKIDDFKTVSQPYEGHYLHHDIKVSPISLNKEIPAGSYIVPTKQFAIRYIMETLEPQADDSFFAWNYFDAILSRKEWFSDYVFEDVAAELLEKNPDLKKRFDEKKASDPKFADSAYAQLQFIYENSEYAEKDFRMYPVLKVMQTLPIDNLEKVSQN